MLHQNSGECVLQPGLRPQDAQGLVGIGDTCPLNLDDDVALFQTAFSSRAGWIDRGHHHDRLTIFPPCGSQIQTESRWPIRTEDNGFRFGISPDPDVHCCIPAIPEYAQDGIASNRHARHLPRQIARVRDIYPVERPDHVAGPDFVK